MVQPLFDTLGEQSMSRVHVFTHTDLDGIAAAAVYLRILKTKGYNLEKVSVHYAEPHNLPECLKGSIGKARDLERVAIMDLGVNASTLDKIIETIRSLPRNTKVEWYDHHKWNQEWIEKVRKAGIELYLDTSTCATEVVARHALGGLDEDDHVWELVKAACAADLWIWDHRLAPYLYRITSGGRGARGDAWRRMLTLEFSECRFWSDSLQEVLEKYIDEELKGYAACLENHVIKTLPNGLKLAIVVKHPGPPNTSFVASYAMSRLSSDIVVVVKRDGALSLRSRAYDVREIAVCIGGGGHPRASGARINVPLYVRILGFFFRKYLVKWIQNKVYTEIKRCCEKQIA